ncbi:hypothetical protein SY89_03375 [Halolamina pelagica]|uniref:DUF7968 domain-containing protein n=1 Tax=Halolamina pelagica TaxID=699431 RepID=A0A0P7GKP9_9EURY|nr:hypothetical protein [Halolamina pelagica]KPN29141.1 hypothetical protein SY89_03375 [Halolamina pelagica]
MGTTENTIDTIDPASVEDQADRIVLSFRSPEADPDDDSTWWVADSAWLQENMNDSTYLQYLQRAHAGPVAVGEEWEEFVNCGCASPQDVVLRVEAIEGGTTMGFETEIELVSRRSILEGDAVIESAN